MSVKFFVLCTTLLFSTTTGWTAPQAYGQQQQSHSVARPAPGDDLTSVLRQLKTGLTDLKHEMRNHEAEIRMFENKLQSQETTVEHLRQQLTDDVQSQRDFVKASNVNLEGKTETLGQSIANLETLVKGLTNDMRQIKTQSNDSVATLGQYKQKISELENLLHMQSQHMQNLEAALQSMMEVWQAKEVARDIVSKSMESGRTYKVQPGDSLEKIARSQKVAVQTLRDANQLINDRILVGQTLKIP
jgi:LysM repeat protein